MKTFLILSLLTVSALISNAQKPKDHALIDSIFSYICEKNIQHPEIVMRQAILETGWMRSEFLMGKNNLFSFRNKTFLTFDTWQESIDYYKSWQEKYYTDPNEDYYRFLIRMKYASKKYPAYLKTIRYNNTCPND